MTEPSRSQVDPSTEFRLDVELAQQAITQLETVRQQMREARTEAAKLATTRPTAHDPISLDAFALLARKADGGPGSFGAAMEAGIVHVNRLIDEMKADIVRQQELDVAAAAGIARRG